MIYAISYFFWYLFVDLHDRCPVPSGTVGDSAYDSFDQILRECYPVFKVNPSDLENTILAARFAIQAPNNFTIVQQRKGKIAKLALRGRCVGLDHEIEVE